MKKNLVWYILIMSLVILVLMIANLLNINYIKQENCQIEILGEKALILKDKQNKVSIPHLNIKGTIKILIQVKYTLNFLIMPKLF